MRNTKSEINFPETFLQIALGTAVSIIQGVIIYKSIKNQIEKGKGSEAK
ncbi:hypothetical protein [Neobacillus niacini]|nr:hypothetical protein [Neobacillus niacini]MCM3767036.1 hypothetical protein [Neobacillus niacini]